MQPRSSHRQVSGSSLAGGQLLGELHDCRVIAISYVWPFGQDHLIKLAIQTQRKSVTPYTGNKFSFCARQSNKRLSLGLPRNEIGS